jgi:hypothetical protein
MTTVTATTRTAQAPLFEGNVGDCSGCSQGATRGFVIFGRVGSVVTIATSLQGALPGTVYNLNWKCVAAGIAKAVTDAHGAGVSIISFDAGPTTHFALDMQAYNASNQMIDNIGSGGVDLPF